ncbi:hypothetical protein BN2537_15139 [Streptomyces venezuelae]|nr:hypothetical protein BN2537_15139 [Streptomyces venezuelae]
MLADTPPRTAGPRALRKRGESFPDLPASYLRVPAVGAGGTKRRNPRWSPDSSYSESCSWARAAGT